MAFDFNKYTQEYQNKNYDRINLRVKKGVKDTLKQKAAAEGRSLNEYILNAIREHEERKEEEK